MCVKDVSTSYTHRNLSRKRQAIGAQSDSAAAEKYSKDSAIGNQWKKGTTEAALNRAFGCIAKEKQCP
jgi:hypothetical protein